MDGILGINTLVYIFTHSSLSLTMPEVPDIFYYKNINNFHSNATKLRFENSF